MTDPVTPSVVQALTAVMTDVQSISKDSRNTQQNFNFRGIDAVVNAVGPVLRKHGVVVVPVDADYTEERYATKTGTQMRGVTATIRFRFYGPAGDYIDAAALGEAADAGDKAVPKAHSVAYRTLLLQALCIPTDEPDPDAEAHERGEAAVAAPPAPVKWPEWTAAMVELGVTDSEKWLQDATEHLHGTRSLKDLSSEQRTEMIRLAFEAVDLLRAAAVVDEKTLTGVFASVFARPEEADDLPPF